MKKLYLFLTLRFFWAAQSCLTSCLTPISLPRNTEWALDALLIAAILGFIAMKWLKHKN